MIGVFLVGTGSFIGGVLRYALATWVHKFLGGPAFPYGTLAVNVSGRLVIGFLAGMYEARMYFNPDLRLFLLIGILGGFTTFSSFPLETLYLARYSQNLLAMANGALQVVLSMVCVWIGHFLGQVAGR